MKNKNKYSNGYEIQLWNNNKIILRDRKQAPFKLFAHRQEVLLPAFRFYTGNNRGANFVYRHWSIDLFYKYTITLELEANKT